MGNTTDAILLIVLIVTLLIIFPEYLMKILNNKIYAIFTGLGIFMILFFVWLKTQNN